MTQPHHVRSGLLLCLCAVLAVGFLMPFLAGCGAMSPGSPQVTLNKSVNVYVGGSSECREEKGATACQCEVGGIEINYTTNSETGITAKIEQQLADMLKLKGTPR